MSRHRSVSLILSGFPAQLQNLSVKSTEIKVLELPDAAGEKLTVQLRAHVLIVKDMTRLEEIQQGARLVLQLSFDSLFFATPVERPDILPREVAARGMLNLMSSSGVCRVSVDGVGIRQSSVDPSFLTASLRVFTTLMGGYYSCVEFTDCDDFASAINDVKDLLPAASQPVFTCNAVQRDDGVSSVEVVMLP